MTESVHDNNVLPYGSKFYSHWGKLSGCSDLSEYYEFPENPSRSIKLAQELQIAINNPIGGPALSKTADFVLSSAEGDEFGITVLPNEQKHRQKRQIVAIASQMLSGFTREDLWQIVWRFLAWGDCFASVSLDENDRLIPRLLPTWQIHLDVDEWTGEVKKVIQRRPGMITNSERIIDLDTFVHWSWRKNHIYGRSIYYEVRKSALQYNKNSEDIEISSREAAVAPTIHEMPEGVDEHYLEAYKRDHKQQLKYGPVSDIYVLNGANVSQLNQGSRPLGAMLDALKIRRLEIAIASQIPLHLLGIETSPASGAQDMTMQPAMNFKHYIGSVRTSLAEKLYQLINKHLEMKGYRAPYPYTIVFPKIELNPWLLGKEEDLDQEGIVDTDG